MVEVKLIVSKDPKEEPKRVFLAGYPSSGDIVTGILISDSDERIYVVGRVMFLSWAIGDPVPQVFASPETYRIVEEK